MLSIEETRALSNIDPELSATMAQPNASGIYTGLKLDSDLVTIRNLLEMFRNLSPPYKPSKFGCAEQNFDFTARDGTVLQVRVHRPKKMPSGGCPGMVVFHGGGFMIGAPEATAWLCHIFTSLGGIAVDVFYRHAPEHPFPIPIQDSFDGLKWVAQSYNSLGIDPSKGFIVAGESTGADIALVCAHLYRDEKDVPPLTGIYAAISTGMTEASVPEKYKDHFISLEQNAHAPMMTAESLQFIQNNYKPDLTSPLAAPILFEHNGIPKTYFQACGLDPSRDCTLITEQVWRDCGIPTKMHVYPGLCHAFWAELPGLNVPSKNFYKRQREDTKEGLKWLLESS